MNNPEVLPWHVVEKSIINEQKWVQQVFDFGPRSKSDLTDPSLPLSKESMLRQISISIVSGKIQAKEITCNDKPNGLWTDSGSGDWELGETNERHGDRWHRIMMGIIKKHFLEEDFEIINEPPLNLGRADLGVYKDGFQNLYVEVGSTSLYKTWFNLHTMPECTFLFVPSVYYALEFKTSNTDNKVDM